MATKYWKPVMFRDKDGNYVYEMLAVSTDYYHSTDMQKQYAPVMQMFIDKRQKEILEGKQ